MKRLFCYFLSLLMLLGLCACQKEDTKQKGTAFYYRFYSLDEAVIQPEYRQDLPEDANLQELLRIYLQGPQGPDLQAPFGSSVKVANAWQEEGTVFVQLSADFADLSGLELSIACGCIAKTCLGLTDAQYVEISAENALLDGAKFIRISENSLLLQDETMDLSK